VVLQTEQIQLVKLYNNREIGKETNPQSIAIYSETHIRIFINSILFGDNKAY